MFALAIAIAATCASSPASLLEMNHRAMGDRPTTGTAVARYAYAGQGVTGWVSRTFDLATGRFVDESETPPIRDLQGFDGARAWFRDLSGAFVPQGPNGRQALAESEAYLNAQAWWRKDRGRAQVALVGCDTLKVTPPGGQTFEARFDPATKLLSSIRRTLTFGVSTEARYSDYRRRSGQLVATQIELFTNGDPGTREAMQLTSFRISPVRPQATYSMPDKEPGGWLLPPSGEVSVPFRLLNNHVILDVKVNGKGPFPFLLDSGGHSIITPATVAALGLTSQGESASGGSGEKMITNGYAHVAEIDVGGARLQDQTVTTLDFSPLAVEGVQLGGMIGLEFLERFVVRIDYGRRLVTIMDRARFDAAERKRAGTPVPFTFYEHMPQVQGSFDGRPARFNIDTGSRSDVTMTSPYVARQKLKAAYPDGVEVTEGWGVGGPARAYLVRAHSMMLGPVEVPGPIAGLSTAQKGAMSDSNYDGNVGSGALKRFVVTFDYAGETMFLKPASRLDADTGEFDRTGMWLNLAESGLRIMDVADGSPAAMAGLMVGDVVTTIGGQSVLQKSLSDVRSSLKTAALGQPLSIGYRRDGKAAITQLTPRTLIPSGAGAAQ